MARVGKDRWVANLHPRNIPVTKTTLRKMLSLYDDRLSRRFAALWPLARIIRVSRSG